MKSAISLRDVGKAYRIVRQEGSQYRTLRDELSELFRRMITGRWKRKSIEDFWALREITFDVQPGDIVGVVGRNGAGKSTLLKILSRITQPTNGDIYLRGRVGSLLEVGTGFHPELTGRENIFLSGAILGMKRREIAAKFDEIVAFAEVDRFLDTPVKRYSSGMYVRLAFAVSAHLDTEILLVDEILAVGDVAFQKKCLNRMKEVGKSGRTVLFVSHNTSAMATLCSRGIFLEKGRLAFTGTVDDTLSFYLQQNKQEELCWTGDEGSESLRLKKTWLRSLHPSGDFFTSSPIEVGIEAELKRTVDGLILGFRLLSGYEAELAYVLYDDPLPPPSEPVPKGTITKTFIIPPNTLAEGSYSIDIDLGIHNVQAAIKNKHGSLSFDISNPHGIGRRFLLPPARGYSSLFRPPWAKQD